MKIIPTKTTFLEMRSPRDLAPAHDMPGELADRTDIERLVSPSVREYRELYRGVGDPYHWVDRLLMPEDDLLRILQNELVDIYVLRVDRRLAGYAELDRRQPDEIELAYFGLFPEFVGQGLGKYLLRKAVEIAWTHHPRRVWLHTCDLDHPAALGNYLKAGFTIYDERIVQQRIPE